MLLLIKIRAKIHCGTKAHTSFWHRKQSNLWCGATWQCVTVKTHWICSYIHYYTYGLGVRDCTLLEGYITIIFVLAIN